jgi:hypothetical protein
MKKKLLVLFIVLIAVTCGVNAQTAKKKPQPKKASTTKTEQRKATPMATRQTENVKPVVAKRSNQTVEAATDYETAIGLKFIYGVSVTGKHFINKNGALEAIVRYRNYGSGVGSEFNFSGLYEYHAPIAGAPGLQWYAGGGAYLGHASFDYPLNESVFNYGITGVLGLEYKIKDVPLAISVDWQPVFLLNAGAGFTGENGGVGVKYAF